MPRLNSCPLKTCVLRERLKKNKKYVLIMCLTLNRAHMTVLKIVLGVHLIAFELKNGLLSIQSEMDDWLIWVLPIKNKALCISFSI
jgi:hypothetical protein